MMQKRIHIKNHRREIWLVTRRTWLALIFMSLLVFILVMRLGYLQIVKRHLYVTLSTKNWLDLAPIEPTRGLIYDRNGVLLVENVPAFSLDVRPFQVVDMRKTLAELGKFITLTPDDLTQFDRALYEHRHFDDVPLKLKLTENEVATFTENQYRFPGFFIKARLIRHYPYDTLFSHVLGYVGRINAQELNDIDPVNYSGTNYIGKLGIEKFYEEELHGTVGYQEIESDASGKPARILKEIHAIPGHNLYLTIDSRLQRVADQALNDHRGAIIVIEPQTGQILALVSKPAYDPNAFVVGISQQDYHAIENSPDKPLFNRALRGVYPLASTIKPYLALAALDGGTVTPDFTIKDPGRFELNTHRYHDSSPYGHNIVNIAKAITVSCDIYFYQLALKMGIARMDSFLAQFGFGEATGIDLDDELTGLVASPAWKEKTRGSHWYSGDTVNAAIGQGYMQATPIQLAAAVATLANRGKRLTPYLLLGEQAPHQHYVAQETTALTPVQLKDSATWETVINAMQKVPTEGTARSFGKGYTYTIAAKTGTGQLVRRRDPNHEDNENTLAEQFRDHHLFIAFAPVDHPKIALAVVTENSNAAIAAARIVFDYYFNETSGSHPHALKPTQAKTPIDIQQNHA